MKDSYYRPVIDPSLKMCSSLDKIGRKWAFRWGFYDLIVKIDMNIPLTYFSGDCANKPLTIGIKA